MVRDAIGNVVFNNQEIENERLELTEPKTNHILGPNLTLRNCTLVLKVSARHLSLKQPQFIGCTFEVKQELKNYQSWIAASFKGCRFKGRLSGCDFGYWPEYTDLPWYQHGFIEDCDFTEAHLDGCRVMGCDPRTLRFPKWPYFTIVDPLAHAPELRGAPWPGRFGEVIIDNIHKQPARTRAMTLSALTEARDFDTTPEALKAALQPFDFIVS